MALINFLSELKQSLSAEARVITDASEKDFQLALLRWSDVDVKIPAAIVQVANESDAVQTVCSSSSMSQHTSEHRMARSKPHHNTRSRLCRFAVVTACGPRLAVMVSFSISLPTSPFKSTLLNTKPLSLGVY